MRLESPHEEALTILQEVEDKWTYGYNKDIQKDLLEVKQALASQNN